jgi:hypothetical protein
MEKENRVLECKDIERIRQIKESGERNDNYKLDIMGMSQIRWKDSGEIKTQNGNFLIFSGVGEGKEHRNGVAILMNKEARKSLMEWSPFLERIILARILRGIEEAVGQRKRGEEQ